MTHPFHPLYGKSYEFVTCHQNWGGEIVYYHDETGELCSLPLKWTSLSPTDHFVSVSAGRAAFRVSDLLEVSRLLAAMQRAAKEGKDE